MFLNPAGDRGFDYKEPEGLLMKIATEGAQGAHGRLI
jgi:hypothetical protein